MEASRQPSSIPPANPPSVEIAYKRKCIALKKRLAEVEAENEIMRTRNRRGSQYIQKMRLETCMLLERLTKVTGMADEAKTGTVNPELRARAAAMMNPAQDAAGVLLEDDTEGSSDEQPRTVRILQSTIRPLLRNTLFNFTIRPFSVHWSGCIVCYIQANVFCFLYCIARGTSATR